MSSYQYSDLFVELMEELVHPEISRKSFGGKFSSYSKNQNLISSTKKKSIGVGTQARVKNDPMDPHMVKKHNTRPYNATHGKGNDGFNIFIDYLITNDLTDNIHFPKVYNIKTITDRDGSFIHTYTMEKLVEFSAVGADQIVSYMDNNLNPDLIGTMPEWIVDEDAKLRWLEPRIERVIDRAVSLNADVASTETLSEAFNIVYKASRELNIDSDLHIGNMMWRRSSTGLTLIINDPFL